MEKEIQKRSLDRFFRSEYRKLVNFTAKNLEDRFFEASPEDIVEDVMLGLIDRLDMDAQIGNLAAYIYRSVRNRLIDVRRKKQQNISLESAEARAHVNSIPDAGNVNPSDEEPGYRDIEPDSLYRAISSLRPDEQAVIIATEFENRTFEELSGEWDIPLGTLLSRKHRALSKLQKLLINNKK